MAGGENIIKTATRNFGRIDILVNCAGFSRNAPSAVSGKWTADEPGQIIQPLLEISLTNVSGG
jgi:NAD(P)-dependent dehydrogenase (short-subunit alcohol dehydrogenase family)